MRQHAHPELFFLEGKARVGPEDERSYQPPGPPQGKRGEQEPLPVGSGKTGQREYKAQDGPEQRRGDPASPVVVSLPFGKSGELSYVCCQSSLVWSPCSPVGLQFRVGQGPSRRRGAS